MSEKLQEFSAGAFAILPVMAAAVPISLLFGTLATAKGLSPLEVWVMSLTIFAGALQFVAIDQWSDPAPIGFLTFTALVVNIRHVLMGASLGRSMHRFGRGQKLAAMFYLTDEGWAFAEQRVRKGVLTPAFYFGSGIALWVIWSTSSLVGALAGTAIGDPSQYGFDFAFSAVFICILSGFWQGWRTACVLAASGVVAAIVSQFVSGAWFIMAGALAGVVVAALLYDEKADVNDAQATDRIMPS